MKRNLVIRVLTISLIILINFLLQSTLFQYLELGGIAPNLLIIVTVSFALTKGKIEGAIIGFVSGLFLDIFFGHALGFYALVYMYIGYLNGFVYQSFYRESLLIPTIMVIISDFCYSIIVYFFTYLFRAKTEFFNYFSSIIIPQIVYTTFITLFLYRIILFLNNKLEEMEKGV